MASSMESLQIPLQPLQLPLQSLFLGLLMLPFLRSPGPQHSWIHPLGGTPSLLVAELVCSLGGKLIYLLSRTLLILLLGPLSPLSL